ncbi:MAG TPA: mercury methylation ferredoxin HgcB [Thermodesulfobacteriota bacterium]|nr:mercury methylation ferredoxin HgcB [Thermodesulfobacteriota bacterium]
MRYLSNVSTLKYVSEKCRGCGRCVEVCPHGVFEMRDKRAAIIDRNLCMECGACALNCEFGAISVNAGVGCAAAIIRGMLTGTEPVCGCSDSGSTCC